MFLTDNPVLLRRYKYNKPLICAQKSAKKMYVTEADLLQSNIDGFGNQVGMVTNWVTSMYDVQSQFAPGSQEYEALAYRIQAGQMSQQNEIDHAKGVMVKPMTRYWHDKHGLRKPEEDDAEAMATYELNERIVADRKPYFMRYVYPSLMREYNGFVKRTNLKSMSEFRMTVDELFRVPEEELTERQREFIYYYDVRMPVGDHPCTMNRICHRIEELLGSNVALEGTEAFDYEMLKSGVKYSSAHMRELKELYAEHRKKARDVVSMSQYHLGTKESIAEYSMSMLHYFRKEAERVCSNMQELCEMLLDICYNSTGTRQFIWDVAGEQVVLNLLEKNGGVLYYPVLDPDGDFEYRGDRYSMTKLEVDLDELRAE